MELGVKSGRPPFPLENITRRIYLNKKWQLEKWSGSLQLQQDEMVARPAVDVQTYLQNEVTQQRDKTKAAEQMLALGNSALAQGHPPV